MPPNICSSISLNYQIASFMKKIIYVLLGLLMLVPAFAESSAKHTVKAATANATVSEIAFAFTYTSAGSPNYYNVTIGCYVVDLNLLTVTEVPAANSFSISILGGPLAGNTINWPANQMSFGINGLYFPLQPGSQSANVFPASVGGIPVLQGVFLLSDLLP